MLTTNVRLFLNSRQMLTVSLWNGGICCSVVGSHVPISVIQFSNRLFSHKKCYFFLVKAESQPVVNCSKILYGSIVNFTFFPFFLILFYDVMICLNGIYSGESEPIKNHLLNVY
jgi:hypothetical protein